MTRDQRGGGGGRGGKGGAGGKGKEEEEVAECKEVRMPNIKRVLSKFLNFRLGFGAWWGRG